MPTTNAPFPANSGALDALSLAALESFDGRSASGGGGANRRFLCPFCGDGKKRDGAHRSLSLETQTGLWNCHRCEAHGKLTDFWTPRNGALDSPRQTAKTRAKSDRARLSELRPLESKPDDAGEWRARLRGLVPLAGTGGAAYLESRGVPLDVAQLAGVRFCPDWFGSGAAVFPIRDRAGALVAAQGRHTSGSGKFTTGPKSHGVFFAPALADGLTFGALDSRGPGVIVCEAPIDALSLAACGFPALALCGVNGANTSGPPWLHLACGLRRVFLAFDDDEAGEAAAGALASKLSTFGARCERLAPETGKDWNEALLSAGSESLADWLAWRVLLDADERQT
jgi:phage/plasmid primase-like uncharacterized protein